MENKPRILFVDDDLFILRSLQRGLRNQDSRWDLVFACGGSEALAELAKGRFDIVVSDVNMPRPDGVSLLREVASKYPDTVRILMSGTAEGAVLARAVPVAHQFLSKPCEMRDLVDKLERVIELRKTLSPGLRAAVGSLLSVPSTPTAFRQLAHVLRQGRPSLDEIAAIVELDPALAVRVLHIANSAFFAAPAETADIVQAIHHIGANLLSHLVLATDVFSLAQESTMPEGFSPRADQSHAMHCAMLSSVILGGVAPASAYTAGLLHDVGRHILALRFPDQVACATARAAAENRSLLEVERERLGVTHAEVGAYLLGILGLPVDIVRSLALQHTPAAIEEMDLAATIHIADGLLCEGSGRSGSVDNDLIERLGLGDRMPEWRAAAADIKAL